MPKESEITKSLTRVIKSGDKLVRDFKTDAAQLIAAGIAVKEIITDIKSKFEKPDDNKEV